MAVLGLSRSGAPPRSNPGSAPEVITDLTKVVALIGHEYLTYQNLL